MNYYVRVFGGFFEPPTYLHNLRTFSVHNVFKGKLPFSEPPTHPYVLTKGFLVICRPKSKTNLVYFDKPKSHSIQLLFSHLSICKKYAIILSAHTKFTQSHINKNIKQFISAPLNSTTEAILLMAGIHIPFPSERPNLMNIRKIHHGLITSYQYS